jgi:hypothetical protein
MSHGGGHVGGGHYGGAHHGSGGQPDFVPGGGPRRPSAGRLALALLFGVAVVVLILVLSH